MDLSTASQYLNNLLAKSGLLKSGVTVNFHNPSSEDGSLTRIINLVHDLLTRREKEEAQLENLANTIRQLRNDNAKAQLANDKLKAKCEDLERKYALLEGQQKAFTSTLRTAEASAKSLRDETARLKMVIQQVRAQAANDLRKRDVQIEKMKERLLEPRRASKSVTTIAITGGSATALAPGSTSDVEATEGNRCGKECLHADTAEALTELAQTLSSENDNLVSITRQTLSTLKSIQGIKDDFVMLPLEEDTEHAMLSACPRSFQLLSDELASTVAGLRELANRPNFQAMEELERKDQEIEKLKARNEAIQLEWRKAIDMVNMWNANWSSRNSGGGEEETGQGTAGGLEQILEEDEEEEEYEYRRTELEPVEEEDEEVEEMVDDVDEAQGEDEVEGNVELDVEMEAEENQEAYAEDDQETEAEEDPEEDAEEEEPDVLGEVDLNEMTLDEAQLQREASMIMYHSDYHEHQDHNEEQELQSKDDIPFAPPTSPPADENTPKPTRTRSRVRFDPSTPNSMPFLPSTPNTVATVPSTPKLRRTPRKRVRISLPDGRIAENESPTPTPMKRGKAPRRTPATKRVLFAASPETPETPMMVGQETPEVGKGNGMRQEENQEEVQEERQATASEYISALFLGEPSPEVVKSITVTPKKKKSSKRAHLESPVTKSSPVSGPRTPRRPRSAQSTATPTTIASPLPLSSPRPASAPTQENQKGKDPQTPDPSTPQPRTSRKRVLLDTPEQQSAGRRVSKRRKTPAVKSRGGGVKWGPAGGDEMGDEIEEF
ncbi:Afadin and alpha-actinin-binding-domain-containing protein [Kalaharituber pfeilii]|nr:Afadin and alpha-actinin-binding-domain-containing protein [Kalaharituber pfeilii]